MMLCIKRKIVGKIDLLYMVNNNIRGLAGVDSVIDRVTASFFCEKNPLQLSARGDVINFFQV